MLEVINPEVADYGIPEFLYQATSKTLSVSVLETETQVTYMNDDATSSVSDISPSISKARSRPL